jgi:membrane protease YdiL (CAAX protease family)
VAQFVEVHPAVSLTLLAMALGAIPVALVGAGLLSSGFSQLGALSASAAGVILAAIEGGRGRVRELLRRALVWRVGVTWWCVALLLGGVIAAGALLLSQLLAGVSVGWSELGPVWNVLPIMAVLVVLAGLGEEFGWRGYLLPRLQLRHTALVSSLIVGAFHSLWHLPLFFLDGVDQQEMAQTFGLVPAFLGYSVVVIGLAVLFTWVFNNTAGSVLMVAVCHGALNAWIGGYFDVAGRAGAVGRGFLLIVTVLVALAVVMVSGPRHLSRKMSRDTLPDASSGSSS